MSTTLLKSLLFVFLLAACSRQMYHSKESLNNNPDQPAISEQPIIASDKNPASLMDLPQTQDGGFVLSPGFYEAEFKTYCLQPGTPDPSQGDAYLQSPMTGYRKEIVQTVLLNSRDMPEMNQKNIQLLLWSVVSGSDFNKLSYSVKQDARQLLTPKQIFELQGGVVGLIKTVSYQSGLLNANSDLKKLFEIGTSSYENFERLAVLREPSKITKKGIKYDTWYKQKENYYVRYFPLSYQKVRIQVFVPDGLLDAEGKAGDEYLVFDPTGQQAIPAFTNAQRLGIGAPVIIDVVRKVIQIKKVSENEKKLPEKKKKDNPSPKTSQPNATAAR
jgi:hypothetical protein